MKIAFRIKAMIILELFTSAQITNLQNGKYLCETSFFKLSLFAKLRRTKKVS